MVEPEVVLAPPEVVVEEAEPVALTLTAPEPAAADLETGDV